MKKRVLHVLKMREFSGAENIAAMICSHMPEEIVCVYTSPDGPVRDHLEKEHVPYLPMKRFSLAQLWYVLRAYQPDMVHAHDFSASVLCALVLCLQKEKGLRHARLVSHLHNDPPWIRRWNVRSVVYAAAKKRIDTVVAVSCQIPQEAVFLDEKEERVAVLENPVDTGRIASMAKEPSGEPCDLLFVGRLTEQKQPLRFIEIVYRLKRQGVAARALMLGDGELKEACRERIRVLGMEHQVEMKGFCDNPYAYMRQARLLLMPSCWEGYGLVAVEALAVGTPVLAGCVGGLKGIFRDVPCALCKNEDEFVEKAACLLQKKDKYNEFLRMSLLKVRRMDMDEYIRKIVEIYGSK